MTRIHLSASKELSKDLTYIPGMAADYLFKPNGLWYAINDNWIKWVKKMGVESLSGYNYKFELDVDFSKVCVLDNIEAVLEFHKRYSFKYDHGYSAIPWEKVAKDYSGIEIIDYEYLYI